MARVVGSGHRSAMDPVKLSAPLGGALVFLGLDRSIPVLHGSQGCAAFAKALLTRHFREPVPMQSTAVTEVPAVLGPAPHLHAALDTITQALSPQVIGVLSTGLVEASGEDLDGVMDGYRRRTGGGGPLVVAASTPDFVGGLSEGWSTALTALVTQVVQAPVWPPPGLSAADGRGAGGGVPRPTGLPGSAGGIAGSGGGVPGPGRDGGGPVLPVLAGVSLTAADLDEIAWLVSAFGLRPVLVPDLSGSLDGHLADGWSPLTTGGTTTAGLGSLREAPVVHAVGVTAAAAAAGLASLTGAEVVTRAHLAGTEAVDGFVRELAELGGTVAPQEVRRWRSRFADTLLDAHLVLGGRRIAIAAEPEHLAGVAALLAGVGAEVVAAVAPTPHALLAEVPCEEVVVGDLEDLRERAREAGAELVVGSSHAGRVAAELGAAHLPCGIPVHDRLGTALRGISGYRAGTAFLVEAANRLLERAHHADPALTEPALTEPALTEPALTDPALTDPERR
ncbi:MAG TPA: nitrogenase component 1 [Kineosporiaceae bacterium]|nr:nitrogenase component 1 [Kineosporiaceae bacterium]